MKDHHGGLVVEVQAHAALGDGAGLVQHHGVQGAGGLQDLGALDDHAELRGAAGTHQQGRGRGQAQGARAGDDQDGHGSGQGRLKLVPGEQPHGESGQGQADDDGYEHLGDTVGQTLDGGLATLRGGHHPADPGQRGALAHGGCPHQEGTRGVDGGARDRVPRTHLHGHGLAGEHRGVHGAATLDHHSVGGDLLPWPHGEQVPGSELVHGHGRLRADGIRPRRTLVVEHVDGVGGARR